MNNPPKLAVRWVHTESGRILMENYEGPQKELPTVCVDYAKMPDGSTRVVREWVAGERSTVPGIGVCRVCDAASVPVDCYGSLIEDEVCLGCGRPVYELLRRRSE